MKLIDKLAALFGRKEQPKRDGYFAPESATPAEILRYHAEECDSEARRCERQARMAQSSADIGTKMAISHRNRAAEYRFAADGLDGGEKSEAA